MEVIRLNAGNDRNGNPRRCYVFLEDTEVKAVADEGYRGSAAMREQWRGLCACDEPPSGVPSFATTPAEYRALLRDFS